MVKLCFKAGEYPVVVMIRPNTLNGFLEAGMKWDKIRIEKGRLDNADSIFECPSDMASAFPPALKEALLSRCDEYLSRPSVKKEIASIIRADMEIAALVERHKQELAALVEPRDEELHRVVEGARLFGGFKLEGYPMYGDMYSKIPMLSHRGEQIVEEWHPSLDPEDYQPTCWEF